MGSDILFSLSLWVYACLVDVRLHTCLLADARDSWTVLVQGINTFRHDYAREALHTLLSRAVKSLLKKHASEVPGREGWLSTLGKYTRCEHMNATSRKAKIL